MKEITKDGVKEIMDFECEYCGCLFKSDEYDVYDTGQVSGKYSGNVIEYKAIFQILETCPTCGIDVVG